jgi:hypothetical protein
VFAVVEQYQHPAVTNEPQHYVYRPLAGLVGKAQRARRRHGDRVGICDRCQVDVPHPVGELGSYLGGHVNRKPCLPGAACTGQRDEPVVGECLADVANFRPASDEAGQVYRKIRRCNDIRGAQRGEVIVQIRMAKLHNPFRAGQVAKWMRAEVVKRDAGGKLINDKRFRRTGEHRLTAVSEVPQPRGAVDRRTDVVAFVAQMHITGVHTDPQLDRRQRRSLQVECAGNRVGGPCERNDEAVALALFDWPHPAMSGDRVGEFLVEPLDGCLHGLGLGLPQPRRTFDVGQQQRDRSRRKLAHVGANVWFRPTRFTHASQHGLTSIGETSAKSPLLAAWARLHTRRAPRI